MAKIDYKVRSYEVSFDIPAEGWYTIGVKASVKGGAAISILSDGLTQGNKSVMENDKGEYELVKLWFDAGEHRISLSQRGANVCFEDVSIEKAADEPLPKGRTTLTNPDASPEAKALMKYLGDIYGKGVITGQHTKDFPMNDIKFIKETTGKYPALCGFELLGYSPNVNRVDTDEACITEVDENKGTVECALKWAKEYKGIITYTWHWFSPVTGKNKAFYTEHTDFDLSVGMIDGTPENLGLIHDMDVIAEELKKFRDAGIPILWRPLHEAEGGWFWWGAKGAEPCKWLWRTMYERYTKVHGLNNLIWVWNSVRPEWYPGDDCVDIISTDIYGPRGNAGPMKCEFDTCSRLNVESDKIVALGECGTAPDPEQCIKNGAPWAWYMVWCGMSGLHERFPRRPGSEHPLKKIFDSPYAITLGDLPDEIKYKG